MRATLLMLVSSAAEMALSLHPSPASEMSAFSRMRALVSICAELLPARTKPSSRSRSSALNFTTYFLTAISFPATNLLHRCPRSDRDSEKHHRFKDAGDYHLSSSNRRAPSSIEAIPTKPPSQNLSLDCFALLAMTEERAPKLTGKRT